MAPSHRTTPFTTFARRIGWISGPLAVAITVSLLGDQPTIAAPTSTPSIPKPAQVAGVRVTPVHAAAAKLPAPRVEAPRPVNWPAAGTTTVDLSAGAGSGAVTIRKAPRTAALRSMSAAPSNVSLTVHDRATTERAGVDGLLLSLQRPANQGANADVAVNVNYSSFANAGGGDWASRLRLVRLPACALVTPEKPACQQATAVPTTNNVKAQTLAASSVTLASTGTTVLAAEAGASGDNGDYTATDLSAASTWQVTDQTGDFSWSYPLRLPPGPGGAKPSVSLAYSSQSIDGLTGATNNQGGWIGDGWSMWPGFIERKYASCADDNPDHKTNDQCWFNFNATLSMNGHAGELVQDGDVWRLKKDDGTVVRRLTNRTTANGDNDDEYWQVTTTDGTQYFFGYHRLPGWSSDDPVTNSTWTVPVYGNNDNEPCHKDSGFTDSRCNQAWRWNLDYVLDSHGNSMAYFYQKEEGAYGRDTHPDQRTTYDRGGYLTRIEYGMRQNAEYSQAAPLRVVFNTEERCLADCWKGEAWKSDPVKSHWPDTPWDQYCTESPCNDQPAPTFWSARRLTSITAQMRTGTTSYANVESWKLRQRFISAGTGEGIPLWLDGITRTGEVTRDGGTAQSDPEIVFSPGDLPMDNRVDAVNDQRSALARWRIKSILSESGGKTLITYSEHDCTRSNLPDPKTNTTRCMPAYYSFAGDTKLDWFHKYVVTRIDLDDVVSDEPDQTIFYDYLDKPAWHYIDDEITKAKYRTWGEWRGYSHVRIRKGNPTGSQSAVEYTYLRGMDGDYLSKDIPVEGRWGGPIADHEGLQGFVREQTTFDGPGGKEVSSTINDPWLRGPTATRKSGDVTTKAWMSQVGTSRTRSALTAGGYRTTKTAKTYNNDSLIVTEDDFGDQNASGDETCTRTTYARNTTTGMVDHVAQTEKLSLSCAVAPQTPSPATVLSRTRTFYDLYNGETSFGRAPTHGDPVRTENLETFTNGSPNYIATSKTYDPVGRVLSETSGRGYTSTTQYRTNNGGLLIGTTETNALGHQVVTDREPAWDLATKITDANNLVTELTYDGLGRLTNAWLPGRNRTADKANLQFSYDVRNSGNPSAVTTRTLLPTGTGYKTSIVLYDGFLRERQSQVQAPGGGRTLADTFYDEAGQKAWESQSYYDKTNAVPDTVLGQPQGQIPSISEHVYDGAGRETATVFKALGAEKWRTTKIYGGDRTTTIPPMGGTATTEITDAHGNVTAMRQYHDRAAAGSTDPAQYDETQYSYTLLNQRKTIVDPLQNTWSYAYDLLNHKVKEVDPDKGTTLSSYDADGNLSTTTTPLGALAYTYDKLDRKTSTRDNSDTGPLRAEWVYDQTPMGDAGTPLAKGKITSSTRYAKSSTDGTTLAYTSRTDKYDAYTRPVTTSVVVSPSDTSLCAASGASPCTYTTQLSYKVNGQLATTTLPAAADLPQEKLTYGYTDVGEAGTLYSGSQIYVDSVTYDKLGELTQRVLGDSSINKHIAVTSAFDEPTRRLTSTNVVPKGKPETVDYTYAYDPAGNITEISDTPEAQQGDIQCYRYDYLRRMTAAWTPGADDCNSDPSYTALGGAAPYWRTWTFDATGNRTTEVVKAATGDTTYTYTSPPSGPTSVRPHTVASVTASGAASTTKNYTYDDAGNTKTRPAPTAGTQGLTWNAEGNLETVTDGAASTSYIYDADGKRLIRADPNGSRTLYLDNGTEIRFDKPANTKKATRYYTHADNTTIAVRGGGTLSWIVGDHHGTAEVSIDATTLAPAKRRTLPYGELRGTTAGTWPSTMDKGMVGGTVDPTGLTHLGAREYDPALGRFISVDPQIDPSNPQTLHGYLYSNNSPATFSDPTGRSWGTFFKVAAIVLAVAAVVAVAVVAGPALLAAGPALAGILEAGATTAVMTGSATATAVTVGTAVASEAAVAGGSAMAWGAGAAALTSVGVAGRIYAGSDPEAAPIGPRPGNKQPRGGGGRVLSDGEGATDEEMALSQGTVKPGPRVDSDTRDRVMERDRNDDGSWNCWRCGWQFWDPSLCEIGHRNCARSNGGTLADENLCVEGWACNSSAQNRGRPSDGMSCQERYTCGDIPKGKQRTGGSGQAAASNGQGSSVTSQPSSTTASGNEGYLRAYG